MTYIGDAVNDKILCIKRQVTFSFMDHTDQIQEWIGYIREGCLCHETDIPNEHAIMNTLYCNECATIRKNYVKTHKRPEGPLDMFKNEMSKNSITYRAAMENYAKLEQTRACQARGERAPARHPQHGCDNNRQSFNGGRGRGRERSRDALDRRSRDDTRSSLRRPPRYNDHGHNHSRRDQNRGRDHDRVHDHNRGRDQGRGRDHGRDRGRHNSRDAHASDKGSDRSRFCSRDRDNCSSPRSDSRSRGFCKSNDANFADYEADASFVNEGYHVDVAMEAAERPSRPT